MRSSKPEKSHRRPVKGGTELRENSQLGLDFVPVASYSVPPQKEREPMNQELLDVLEAKIGAILEKYNDLKEENAAMHEEIQRLINDREGIKSRVDSILGKLDGF